MTGSPDDELFRLQAPPPTPEGAAPARWGRVAVIVLVTALVGVTIAIWRDASTPSAAAPQTPAAATSGSTAPATLAVTAQPTPIPTPAPNVPVKDTSTPMPPAERAAAEAELQAFVDAHLQAPVQLESPADWARWGTSAPTYANDIDGCPQIAARLGADLGGRWTYTFGTLPGRCHWTPVPWVPEADPALRYFEIIGFVAGADVRSADTHTRYQAAGTPCPEVDAPAVADGAFVVRCQDPADLTYDLVLPDAAGRGVWTLSTYAGHAQTGHTAQEGLLALITAAQAVY